MCIDKDRIMDHQARFLARKIFINDLVIMVVRGSFYVGVYKYVNPGSLSDWIVVFKVACGASYEIQSVIDSIAYDAQQVPILLSRQETSDFVASIRS